MAKLIPSIACLGSAKFCPLNNSFDQYSMASFNGEHRTRKAQTPGDEWSLFKSWGALVAL